jgi:hypothetical protein
MGRPPPPPPALWPHTAAPITSPLAAARGSQPLLQPSAASKLPLERAGRPVPPGGRAAGAPGPPPPPPASPPSAAAASWALTARSSRPSTWSKCLATPTADKHKTQSYTFYTVNSGKRAAWAAQRGQTGRKSKGTRLRRAACTPSPSATTTGVPAAAPLTAGQAGQHAQVAGGAASAGVQHPKAVHQYQLGVGGGVGVWVGGWGCGGHPWVALSCDGWRCRQRH